MFKSCSFEQDKWDDIDFRKSYLKWYIEKNNESTEIECLQFIKAKFGNKISLNENIVNEIKRAKVIHCLKKRPKDTIITQLIKFIQNININIT